MASMMEVGNGEEEDLSDVVHDVSRPLDEWPPPPSLDTNQKNNLNQSASRLLFLAVEYVEEPGVSNNTAFNTSFEGEAFPQLSELEQRVVSPLDPNMSCTACYSPVQYTISRPSSPFPSSHTIIVDPPSSQQVSPSSHGYLSSTQATSLSSPSHTTASLSHSPLPQPDPGLIVMGNQFNHHSAADNYVVTSTGRIIADFQTDDHDTMSQTAHEVLNDPSVLDSDKLLLHASGLHHPSELVVSGGDEGVGLGLKETETNGRVELLLSNGSIAYGIVEAESTLVGGSHRIIQIPREYLLAATRGQTTELTAEEEENHLRAVYNTLKTQGIIVETSDGGELRLIGDLEQNEHLLDPGLLDQSVLLNEQVDSMSEPMATDSEQSYQNGDSATMKNTSAEEPDMPSGTTEVSKTYWCEDCNTSLDCECSEHRVNSIISDKPIPSRARATLPASYLVINKLNNSLDPKIEYGVFARKVIPKRTQFGPIEGIIHETEDLTEDIVPNCGTALLELSIEIESGEMRKLDISDENASNWMRFVRPATCVKEQNLILSQQGLSLYFTTTQTIHPRQELKVWYNTFYASKRKLPILEQEKDEQWPCFECDQKFKSSEELQKHLNVHEIARDEHDEVTKTKKTNHYMLRRKVQPYLPPIKKYKLGEKKNKFSANSKNPYECIICKRVFQRSYSLKRHILQHTGDKKYSCTVCQLSFSHLYNRDRHMKRCHPKKSGGELQENKNKAKDNVWQCAHCNLTFTSASVLNLHTLTHAADNLEESEGTGGLSNDISDACFKKQNGKIGCPQCTEEFSSKKELIQHVSTHGKKHQAKDKQFRCECCSKLLATSEGLQKHSLVHESDESKPYQCDVCKKRFTHNYGLTCHMKTHETGKVFECPICKEQFDLVLSLKNHIHTHSENGVYKCPHCSKGFEVYSLIRKHILAVHTRKHTCHYCGKNYPFLEKHMLMHSDHREFLCANCGKQFKRKDKLVEHMRRMHTVEREQQIADKAKQGPANKKTSKLMANANDYERFIYKCHTCMLGFKRRGMLVNHLANRHPEITPDSVPELNLPILKTTRDYYCQYCEKIYKSSSKRKAHILKNHPGLDLPMSNRQKGGIPDIPGMPNPTYSQPVGSITTDPQGCQWCHKQYASKAKLLQHQRKKHLNLLPRSQQVPRPTKSQEDSSSEKNQDTSNKNTQPAVEKNGRTPVPVALSTIHSINLLQGDYEIVTADAAAAEYGDNGIVIDAAELKHAVKVASQCRKNTVSDENTENNGHDKTSAIEQGVQPVPVALSTVHPVNLLSGVPGDYEIVTADGEFAENGMIIDAATLKRAVKAEVMSTDLLSQTVAELGISLPDLQALSNDQYVKIIQTPNGVVAQAIGLSDSIGVHDPFFTPYTAR